MKLSVSYDFLPKGNSVRASIVMDHFGIDLETGRHVIAEDLELPIEAGDVVLFTGASGSGKSSLMRAAAETLRMESWGTSCRAMRCAADPATQTQLESRIPHLVIDVDELELPDALLIDAWALPVGESMALLSACGLGEAQLLLRRPAELSEGQRYRYRLATALALRPAWIVADEFSATLDRTLAKVVAFNVRRLAERTGTGFLLATTHDDVAEDLAPDVHVRCRLDGEVEVEQKKEARCPNMSNNINRDRKKKRAVSFAGELAITPATRADWAYFARWHYRGHGIGMLKFATLLWHGEEPIGICVFTSPPLSLRPRNRYFGRSGKWERTSLRALNRQLVMLSRVVIHPTYRGAGLAVEFVRRSCELSGFRWIETLTQMGHINPFFEKAGFVRVGTCRHGGRTREEHSAIYGGRGEGSPLVSEEAHRKSRFAEPVYSVLDNRGAASKLSLTVGRLSKSSCHDSERL